jgi:predicted phage-related endonuclease
MITSTHTERTAMTTSTVTTTSKVEIIEIITDLDPAMEAKIVEFNEAKAAIKALEAKKQAAETAIREALKGNNIGFINGVERVRVSHRNMSKIDRDLLKTAFPEAYMASLVESPYTVLQAK